MFFCVFCYFYTVKMSGINDKCAYVKMLPKSQNPGLQPALKASIAKLSLHTAICFIAFATEVVSRVAALVVCFVHSHILDQIQAQTHKGAFGKFIF